MSKSRTSVASLALAPLLAALAVVLVSAGCSDDGSGGPDSGPDAAQDSGATDAGDAGGDGGDAGPQPFEPDAYCPGPGCEDEPGPGTLQVGAGKAEITAIDDDGNYVVTGEPYEKLTTDVDGDGEYDADEDEFTDLDGDGQFDGVWIAGFGNNRGATGVNDPQWVRAIALRNENTTLVLTAIDCVGYFKKEMDLIRERVSDLSLDHVFIAATHVHEARDTVGLWGRTAETSGLDSGYMQHIRQKAEQAIRDAVSSLQPAHIQYASFRLRDLTVPPDSAPDGMSRFVGDARDPNIIDDEVRAMRFTEASGGADGGMPSTIATMVNWGSHPEYSGSENTLLSSDFPHWIRKGIEEGVMGPDGPVEGVGGTAVFFNGALGSQIGPNRVDIHTWDGTPVEEKAARLGEDNPAATVVGRQIAYFVLRALGPGGGSVTDETAELAFKTDTFRLPLENSAFRAAYGLDIFDREVFTDSGGFEIESELTSIDIGRAQLLAMPGELNPELFVGGYDGSHKPEGQPLVQMDNPNPPNLDEAPSGPYLQDRARDDAEYVFLMGLGNDFLGYFIPSYNYKLSDTSPYFEQADGHYEETVTVGEGAWPTIQDRMQQLLQWSPDG